MARELKEGYNKFPPASRRLAQSRSRPSFGWKAHSWVARGLAACRLALLLQSATVRLLDPEEPAGAEGEGQGCERRFCSRVQCSVHGNAMHLSASGPVVMNDFSRAERAGGRE